MPTIIYPKNNKSVIANSIHTPESLLKKVETEYKTDATNSNSRHTVVCVALFALSIFGSIQPFLKYYFPQTIFVLLVIFLTSTITFFFIKTKIK